MPEGLLPEVAHHAAHHGHGKKKKSKKDSAERREELLEIVEAVLLAVVAIATAWSGYQTGRWDGFESHEYSLSSQYFTYANQASVRSGQGQLYDASVFSFWLQAEATGNRRQMALFERRFRPAMKTAFTAWLATDPLHNASAPPGPQTMPQYKPPGATRAAALDAKGAHAFELGGHARENGDRYLRDTVLLATVLFLTAIAPRFKIMAVRIGLSCVSLTLLLVALGLMVTYPIR